MLFFERLKYKLTKLFGRFKLPELKISSMIGIGILVLIIVVLTINISNSYNKGVDTIENFHNEELKLMQLQKENAELKEQVAQIGSLDYKKIYARENLNLGERSETLYYVDRPKDAPAIEGLETRKIEIAFNDNFSYWKKLILGL